jgi:hypothetical protein
MSFSIVWKITGLIALVLLLATFSLAVKSRAYDDSAIVGYVTAPGSSAYLRSQPSEESRIVTILERDTVLWIKNSITKDSQTWYHVETDADSGWIPSENVSLEHP